MIEVIASDFSRLESDTTSAEEQAAAEYKEFMNDSEVRARMNDNEQTNKSVLINSRETDLGRT